MVDFVSDRRRGNVNARFWTRPDIERARCLVDLWASQVMHSECVPMGTEVLEGDRRALTRESVFEIEYSGPEILVRTSRAPVTSRGLHPSVEAKLLVSGLLGRDQVLTGLLLWLYPRTGPYSCERDIRGFRPQSWVAGALEGYEGKDPGRFLDSQLNKMHKGFLIALADHVRSVA